MTFIRVDRDSVKRNPRSGRTDFQVCTGPPTYERRTNEVSADGETWIITNQTTTRTDNVQTIHTLAPAGPFLFDYLLTKVKCVECNCEFDHTKLESESEDNGSSEYDWYSERVCPRCGKWDCCELEFEKLSNEVLGVLSL